MQTMSHYTAQFYILFNAFSDKQLFGSNTVVASGCDFVQTCLLSIVLNKNRSWAANNDLKP